MVAKKTAATAAKKTSAKETAATSTARKTATKTATKATTKTASATKAKANTTTKTTVKTTAGKPAAEIASKAAAKEAPVRKRAAATKTAAVDVVDAHEVGGTKAPAKKTAARKTAAKRAAGGKTRAATAAEQTGARTVAAKKTVGTATEGVSDAGAVPQARAGELAVRPGEDPWTPAEVEEARTGLLSEVLRLRAELDASDSALTGLMRDSGDGAGDDQADTGTKNITREHELALAANAREMLEQTEHALERLEAGTYGLCEVCGKPIGKARMQAFPRATLCVEDKQKQERRG